MSRQRRIEYPGAIYHVMSRGNARQNIFHSDTDRHTFISHLSSLADRFAIEVHAYVLMPNHYHLLLKTREANLSKAMHWFGTSYTCHFNRRHERVGHLFQGRFKSIIVENDLYLLRLSCYIHCNPWRAGIVTRLPHYPWSSYSNYAYGKTPPPWLTTAAILNQLSDQDPYKAYLAKVQHYANAPKSVWEEVQNGFIYGGSQFASEIKNRHLKNSQPPQSPQHTQLLRTSDPELLLQTAAAILHYNIEAGCQTRRLPPREKEKRDMLAHLLWKTGLLTNQQIATHLGTSHTNISKSISTFNQRLATDPSLQNRYNHLQAGASRGSRGQTLNSE